MSRRYLLDRWCVRCSKKDMTPYLRDLIRRKILRVPEPKNGGEGQECLYAIDIGCGNGRNSEALTDLNFDCTMCDMAGDIGQALVLGRDPLPGDEPYDLVLANYVLMFLNATERKQVYKEIQRVSGMGTQFVVELYAAKDCEFKDKPAIKKLQAEIITRFVHAGWTIKHEKQEHFVLEKNGRLL